MFSFYLLYVLYVKNTETLHFVNLSNNWESKGVLNPLTGCGRRVPEVLGDSETVVIKQRADRD